LENSSIKAVNNQVNSSTFTQTTSNYITTSTSTSFINFSDLAIPSWNDLLNIPYSQTAISQTSLSSTAQSNSTNISKQIKPSNIDFPGITLYSEIPKTLVSGEFTLIKGEIPKQNLATLNTISNQKFNLIFICVLTGNKYYFQTNL
jgi:hypothetical protein